MKKLKLLYAEDLYNTRRDMILYIKSRYDFEIYEASDGADALKLYKKHSPDIVLTDITMPNMSGLEFIKEIRKVSLHTKIIIMTAHSEQEKLFEAFDADVVNYLIKPISRQKLKNSIDTAVSTLQKITNSKSNIIFLTEDTKFNMDTHEYSVNNKPVKLSKSEMKLLELLCTYKNQNIGAYDIFVHIWDDFNKEFSADSIRALIKKLRKKLPDGILQNIYGGFYKLNIS